MKVFVTDAHYKNSLGAVRAIAKEGVEVHAGSEVNHALSFYSHYTAKSYLYPSPVLRRDFLHAIEKLDRSEQYDAILPIGNEAWYTFETSRNEALRKKIPMPSPESYSIACDKLKTLAFAKKLGLLVPETAFPDSPPSTITQLRPPVVMKRALGSGSTRLLSVEEALRQFRQSKEKSTLYQEFVPGIGYGFFGLYNRGRLCEYFMHRRVREVPWTGGASSAAEATYEPELLQLGSTILSALSWHGVAMVEFRRNPDNGKFVLMEINPKFWGSLDLAIASGMNFPYLAVCLAVSGEVPRVGSYRNHLRFCWPVPDDLIHLVGHPSSAFEVLRDWINPNVGKNLWIDDLSPQCCALTILAAKRTISRIRNVDKEFLRTKPERFGWVERNRLAASGVPRSNRQMEWMKNRGVDAVLDLTAASGEAYRGHYQGVYCNVKMIDHMPPTKTQLKVSVEFIERQIRHGHTVLVHCHGGLGRTGTVLACYLINERAMSADEAIEEVRRLRPGSIEKGQERSVHEYFLSLQAGNPRKVDAT